MLTPFEIIAISGAMSGLFMVVGGIWLIAKGAITLAAVQGNAVDVEWKKQFRISTQVPGIAFFMIGLLFMLAAMYVTKPSEILPIEFAGEIRQIDGKQVDEPISISVRSVNWELPANTNGAISGRVTPDLSYLTLAVNAPGYEPQYETYKISANRSLKVGPFKLRRKVQQTDLTANVQSINFTAPNSTFGVSQ